MLTEAEKKILEEKRQAALKRREELKKQRSQLNQQYYDNSSNNQLNNPSGNKNVTLSSNFQLQNSISGVNNQSSSVQTNNSTTNRINQTNSLSSTVPINRSITKQIDSIGTAIHPTINPQSNSSNNSYGNNSTFRKPSYTNNLSYANKRLNSNSSLPNNFNNSTTNAANMTLLRSINKEQNNFITPAKRPNEQNNVLGEKRMNTNVKSPYEQIKENSIPTFEIAFKLLSNREFYLDFRYSSKIIEEVRKYKSARFDATKKVWVYKLEHYKEITDNLKKLKIDRLNIKLGEGFPDDLINILEDSLKYDQVKVSLDGKIKSTVLEQLFAYQKEGIKFGVKREGRCLLADDCGLGKTMQAIGIALYYFDDWPLLIVCPASVKFQWKAALLKWVPSLKEEDIREIDSKKHNLADKSNLVVITSYDSVNKVEPFIKEPKCAILDESHMIKESKTLRYSLISKLVHKSKRLVLISGTPAMSRPVELFTQLKLLMPKTFSNKNKFIDRYCDPQMTPWGKKATGCSRLDELKVVLESTVMIRRMKNDVMSELPAKRRAKINLDCHLTSKDKSQIEKFIARFKGPQQLSEENESFMQAFIKTAEIKLKPILNYLEVVIERETKFLIFAHHRVIIDGITDYLIKKKVTFIKIDGSTVASERSKCCEIFQNNVECKAAVLSITAAGVGLTLTAAQLVIFGELFYNPGALIQAEDRVHRIGQKDSVYIEYLIAPGTVDEHIWKLVHRKVQTLDALGIKNDGFEFDKSQDS